MPPTMLMFQRPGPTTRGRLESAPDLLVLPAAELRSGGTDVHPARPRTTRPDRAAGLIELHLAVLLPSYGPCRRGGCARHAKGGRPGGGVAVRGRLAVLAACIAAQCISRPGRGPKVR